MLQIIESYAFLPREAVTHFLMSCKDCRGRMHLTPSKDVCSLSWGGQSHSITGSPVSSHMLTPDRCSSPASSDNSIDVESDSVSGRRIMLCIEFRFQVIRLEIRTNAFKLGYVMNLFRYWHPDKKRAITNTHWFCIQIFWHCDWLQLLQEILIILNPPSISIIITYDTARTVIIF